MRTGVHLSNQAKQLIRVLLSLRRGIRYLSIIGIEVKYPSVGNGTTGQYDNESNHSRGMNKMEARFQESVGELILGFSRSDIEVVAGRDLHESALVGDADGGSSERTCLNQQFARLQLPPLQWK